MTHGGGVAAGVGGSEASGDRAIADYAAIGDTHSGALVATDGSFDWCCLPHFDSPAVFLRLLDRRRGGFFQIVPARPSRARRSYRPGTNVVETTFEAEDGVISLTDFMPVRRRHERHRPGRDVTGIHRIARRVKCRAGRPAVQLAVAPTPDYARARPEVRIVDHVGVVFEAGPARLLVHATMPLEVEDGLVTGRWVLDPGQTAWVTLTHLRSDDRLAPPGEAELEAVLEETKGYWREWSGQCNYDGPYKEAVVRSALALKLLTFEPTGAILAALTTSLPEEIGGVRKWDYRFMWLGLFAEGIDPVRSELLGNFPQAFTHIALINTAVRLWGSREQERTLRPTAPGPGWRASAIPQ